MSILDQNYDPDKAKYNVRLPEHRPGINIEHDFRLGWHAPKMHGDFKPITSFDDIAEPNACNANNMLSAGGLLFGSYVVQHYSDGNYETSHLIDLLAKIVPPTIDSGYYYKFMHLYNCARSRYEDIVLSSVSCDIDSFTKKDFEKLDDFINNVGSIFDDLVTHILNFVLESD